MVGAAASPERTVLLLRHAKSSWTDPSLDDIDRPLNKRGKRARRLIAAHLAACAPRPDLVLCSPARRARATLKAVRAALGDDLAISIVPDLYEAGAGDIVKRLRGLEDSVHAVLVIGHNPALGNCAGRLVGDGRPAARRRMAAKFPTAALAHLSLPPGPWRDLAPGRARLEDFTVPRDLE